MISAIIPYGRRYEALSVLLEALSYEDLEDVDIHIVALGDDDVRVKPLCDKYGFNYIFVPNEGDFKMGVCLNVGCENAKTQYVLKLDVDCVPYQGFFRKLKEHLSEDSEFSLLSVVYASQDFTERYLQSPPFSEDLLKDALLPENNVNFHYGRPSGTMFLVKREVFSVHGKISEDFTGHGYEDYQVLANLIDPPPIKESKRNGDSAMDNSPLSGGFYNGKEELYDRADHRFIAAGGGYAFAGQDAGYGYP